MKFELNKEKSEYIRHIPGNPFSWRSQTVCGDYVVSLYAGRFAYSLPKEGLENKENYTHIEMAIMDTEGNMPPYEKMQPIFDIVGYGDWPQTKEEFDKAAEILEEEYIFYIFPYMPVEKLDLLFDYLNQ
jgi:hypothetical protein